MRCLKLWLSVADGKAQEWCGEADFPYSVPTAPDAGMLVRQVTKEAVAEINRRFLGTGTLLEVYAWSVEMTDAEKDTFMSAESARRRGKLPRFRWQEADSGAKGVPNG